MIGYESHSSCFRDMLEVAVLHAELTGEKEDSAAAGAPALAELDSCECKGPPPRGIDRLELWRCSCHCRSDNEYVQVGIDFHAKKISI